MILPDISFNIHIILSANIGWDLVATYYVIWFSLKTSEKYSIPYASFSICINYFKWFAHILYAFDETQSQLALVV